MKITIGRPKSIMDAVLLLIIVPFIILGGAIFTVVCALFGIALIPCFIVAGLIATVKAAWDAIKL